MRLSPLPALLGVLVLTSAAQGALRDVLVAGHLLTDIADARVVRLAVATDDARAEPREIYGLAFTFEHMAWFYSAEGGTRILGPATPAWLTAPVIKQRLRDSGANIVDARVYPRGVPQSGTLGQTTLANACVVGSLATLQRLLAEDKAVDEAGLLLLSFAVDDAQQRSALFVDHCVLVFRTGARWLCIDPREPQAEFELQTVAIGKPLDPALIELALRTRYPLKSARRMMIAPSTLEQIHGAILWRLGRGSWGWSP